MSTTSNVTLRTDIGRPLYYEEVDTNFQELKYVIVESNEHIASTTAHDASDIVYSNANLSASNVEEALNALGVKNNLSATSDPTVNNDSSEGYAAFSRWVNTSTTECFLCLDSVNGAAVWVKSSLTLDELGTAALSDMGVSASQIRTNTQNETLFLSETDVGSAAFVDMGVNPSQIRTNAENDQTFVKATVIFDALSSEATGDGAALISMEGGPTVEDAVLSKADQATTYTKTESDEILANYVKRDDIFLPSQPIGDIGVPGTYGFGVGVYPDEAELTDLFPLKDNKVQTSDTFGNYIHTNSSICVFIPKFYYRIGNSAHSNFNIFGVNSIEVRGSNYYANEAEANVDGFILHRAFIDGGSEKLGFFYDKYTSSKSPDDSNISVSNKFGNPISLTTDTGYTRSQGMTASSGELFDSVTLSRARGLGWNCGSIFMRSAIAMLSLAQSQHASSSSTCAWFDVSNTINYPKGCNDNSLGDVNDSTILYQTAGDAGAASKPKTGSGQPFSRTTHNGQNCGVADVNGGMWETDIGLTQPGSSATANGSSGDNTIYILKESVSFSSLTGGWNTTTDIWGDSSHLSTLYNSISSPINLSGLGGWIKWGNGSEPLFFDDVNGLNRSLCGIIPVSDTSLSSGGINMTGNDGIYRYVRENLFVHSCGRWNDDSRTGVFARSFLTWRSYSGSSNSFRSARYVS